MTKFLKKNSKPFIYVSFLGLIFVLFIWVTKNSRPGLNQESNQAVKYSGEINYQYFDGEQLNFVCSSEDGNLRLKTSSGRVVWQKPYRDANCERMQLGHQRPFPEQTNIFVLLSDSAYQLVCQSNEEKLIVDCKEERILSGPTTRSFLMLSKDEKFLLTSGEARDRKEITILNLETRQEKKLALEYQFTYPHGGSFTPLEEEGNFAFWADKNNQQSLTFNAADAHPLIGIYDGYQVRYIDQIPKTIKWGEYTYTIDAYGQIFLYGNDDVCFIWSVSGGHGIFLKKNGKFVQDPVGMKDCPST